MIIPSRCNSWSTLAQHQTCKLSFWKWILQSFVGWFSIVCVSKEQGSVLTKYMWLQYWYLVQWKQSECLYPISWKFPHSTLSTWREYIEKYKNHLLSVETGPWRREARLVIIDSNHCQIVSQIPLFTPTNYYCIIKSENIQHNPNMDPKMAT